MPSHFCPKGTPFDPRGTKVSCFPLPLRERVARIAGRVRGVVGVGRGIIAAQPPHPSPVGRHLLPRWGEGFFYELLAARLRATRR